MQIDIKVLVFTQQVGLRSAKIDCTAVMALLATSKGSLQLVSTPVMKTIDCKCKTHAMNEKFAADQAEIAGVPD